jgi:hypothetical protein
MIDFEILTNVIRVNCADLGFGQFSVLIVPEDDVNALEDEYSYYLMHQKYGLVLFMFADAASTPEEAAERAYNNAPDYIPDFIKQCFTVD